jgi:predicted small lipoprotein YifL
MSARCRALPGAPAIGAPAIGALLLGALLLGGCGQMGPLVLPGAAAQGADSDSAATGDTTGDPAATTPGPQGETEGENEGGAGE